MLTMVRAGQISTLCCDVLTKPCWGNINLSSSCTTSDKATSSSQACLVAACLSLLPVGSACRDNRGCSTWYVTTCVNSQPEHPAGTSDNNIVMMALQSADTSHAGEGVAHADGSYQLKDTAQQYKPGGQFPHLAGCKMLAVPVLPYDEVGHFRESFSDIVMRLAGCSGHCSVL